MRGEKMGSLEVCFEFIVKTSCKSTYQNQEEVYALEIF